MGYSDEQEQSRSNQTNSEEVEKGEMEEQEDKWEKQEKRFFELNKEQIEKVFINSNLSSQIKTAECKVNAYRNAYIKISNNASDETKYKFYDDADKQKYINIKMRSYLSPDLTKCPAKVNVINVGQGVAVLVRNGNGSAALIDKGPDASILENYLKEAKFHRTVDGTDFSKKPNLLANSEDGTYTAGNLKNFLVTLITHNHRDHTGGSADDMNAAKLPTLFCSSGKIIESPNSIISKCSQTNDQNCNGSQLWQKIEISLNDKSLIKIPIYKKDDIYEVSDPIKNINLGLKIKPKSNIIVHPHKRLDGEQGNDTKENADSFITGFKQGNTYFIVPGDAQSEDIEKFVEAFKNDITASEKIAIVSSHHGSITGTKNRLIERLIEFNKEVIFLTSFGDNRKHPSSPVLCFKIGQLKSHINGEYMLYNLPDGVRNTDFDRIHGKCKLGQEIKHMQTDTDGKQLKVRLFYTQNIPTDANGNVQGSLVAKSFGNETVYYTQLTNEDSDSDCYEEDFKQLEEDLKQLNNQNQSEQVRTNTGAEPSIVVEELPKDGDSVDHPNKKPIQSEKEPTNVKELSKSLDIQTSQNLSSEVSQNSEKSQIEASVISPEK